MANRKYFEIVRRWVIAVDDEYMTATRVRKAIASEDLGAIGTNTTMELEEENGGIIEYEITRVNDLAVKAL